MPGLLTDSVQEPPATGPTHPRLLNAIIQSRDVDTIDSRNFDTAIWWSIDVL